MEKIIFYTFIFALIPVTLILLVKKDRAYGNPKIAFWNLAYFMSWFLFLSPVRYWHDIYNNLYIYFIFILGQFLLVSALARYFIDKEKKKLGKNRKIINP